MSTWRTLYFWELKKIMRKRFTVISLASVYLFIVIGIFSNTWGKCFIEGIEYMTQKEYLQLSNEYAMALSGRKIDDGLITETLKNHTKYVMLGESFGETPSEAERKMIADTFVQSNMPYIGILEYMGKVTGMTGKELRIEQPNQEEFYAAGLKNLRLSMKKYYLTDSEEAYWLQKYQKSEKPIVFQYCSAYSNLIAMVYALSALLIMLTGIGLSGIFSEDRTLKSDSLVLSSKEGRGKLYSAKVAAGVTFAEVSAIGLCLVSAVSVFALYGTEGFSAPLQLYKPVYPYEVSIGQFVLVAFGLMLVVVLFMSLFTMFLSVCFSRPIIPMSIIVVCVVSGMFLNIPEGFRLLSVIWDWLPTNYLFVSHMFDLRLVPFFGKFLVSWQILPIFYLAGGAGVVFCGLHKYKSQQVEGR